METTTRVCAPLNLVFLNYIFEGFFLADLYQILLKRKFPYFFLGLEKSANPFFLQSWKSP